MVLALLLMVVALLERVVFDLGPNVELVTMACVLAGMYLAPRWRFIVPLVVMAISDMVLGLGMISLFTWSGFLFTVILASGWSGVIRRKLVGGTIAGVMGTICFYVWTNFGVWLTDGWGMYARDFSGLSMSYINGLPFLKLQLVSTMLFVPLGIVGIELWRQWRRVWVPDIVNKYIKE
jgi:hypothetical protein